jgi:hypothetical protein
MPKRKPTVAKAMVGESGELGIRTPGPVTVNSFQDCRNRPLCQLSAAKIRFELNQQKKIRYLNLRNASNPLLARVSGNIIN